jgi:hypothetical protein
MIPITTFIRPTLCLWLLDFSIKRAEGEGGGAVWRFINIFAFMLRASDEAMAKRGSGLSGGMGNESGER